jgi:hypothetical protein
MSSASKSLTMADLNSAIKPLIESMNRFRETQTGSDAMLNELSQMVTNIMVRLDAHDQTIHSAVTDAVKKAAPKKLAGKGKAAAKKTSKPQLRKGVKKQSEEENEEEAPEEVPEEQEEAPEEQETVLDEQEEAPEDQEEAPEDEKKTKKIATKKAVNKVPVKKTAAKPTAKKAPAKKTAKPKTKTNPNIMTIFKNAFRENEGQFDKVITLKVKKEIESANAGAWSELEGESLLNARANVYREYIKNNHKQVLEGLKEAFAKKQAEEENEEPAEETDDA